LTAWCLRRQPQDAEGSPGARPHRRAQPAA
jgi:hypothetical protein